MNDVLQISALSEELKKLRPNVTRKDKDVAMSELDIKSPTTISKYLNGKGKESDTAAALIRIFKQKISERNLVIA